MECDARIPVRKPSVCCGLIFAGSDPERGTPTETRPNKVSVFIPGVGFRFKWRADLQLFGGLHRGFSPPGPGSAEETPTRAEPEL